MFNCRKRSNDAVKLTQFSNFALRTLQFAAIRHPELVRIDDVAKAHRVSKAHLMKATHHLGQRGFVETVRGRNGGLRLARPAAEITVGEVLRRTEAPLELVECFNPETNTCPLRAVCHLSRAFHRALASFLAVLDEVTIADIARNRSDLMPRLGLTRDGAAPKINSRRSMPRRAARAAK